MSVLAVIAFYLAGSWFGLFRSVADWLLILLLIAFAAAFLVSLLPLRNLRWPRVAEADRMLEERNGLPHQPVTVQEDEPAFDTPFARALWREHQRSEERRVGKEC